MIKLQVIGNLGKDCIVNTVNGKTVINFNVAHTEKDIYDPLNKENQPGFTIHERNSFQNLIGSGFIDSYRHINPNTKEFTFWANRANSRVGNRGWRLDYFLFGQ